VGPNTTLSNSFSQHPIAYFICAGALVALVLYLIFDSKSVLGKSVGWALLASPLSITVLAGAIGAGLYLQLPVLLIDNDVRIGTLAPDAAGQGMAAAAAGVVWLVLMSRWLRSRRSGRLRPIRKERPLDPATEARLRAMQGFVPRIRRDTLGRRLPPE
jgi:multisubunit Na+/H+ antiporter MnhB subunit